jgi:cytosine/adenosine deaminase-related metal-dependent hydrolase
MTYRKISSSKIFDGYRFVNDHVLVMENGRVTDLIPEKDAGTAIEWMEGILCPGLVNCHCHLELSHMKGVIPEKTGLVDFVYQVVTGRHHSDEDILRAVQEAEDEMKRNGIVAVGDICNNALTIGQKKKERLLYYNFIESSGWLPSVAGIRFERAKELFEMYSECSSNRMHTSIVPHAPYSVSENLWKSIRPFFENMTVSMHNQETAFEDEFFLTGTGDFQRMYKMMKIDNSHHLPTRKSSLQSSFGHLMDAANIILVHNTFTRQEDIDYITRMSTAGTTPEIYFCCCPNANLYIENSLPPIDLFRNNRCNITLGTDSLASNHELNILSEIRTIRKNFKVPDDELLSWATINGAKALQMDKKLGSFEKGKEPGVILLNDELELKRMVI